jgi:hypothetical protein
MEDEIKGWEEESEAAVGLLGLCAYLGICLLHFKCISVVHQI